MRLLILDDDRVFGNILKHQITELTNRQWVCHFLPDNRNVKDILPHIDLVVVDKNLDDCTFDSDTIIKRVLQNYPEVKIALMSSSDLKKSIRLPFFKKDEKIAKNIMSLDF